jgi:hypothetical protein
MVGANNKPLPSEGSQQPKNSSGGATILIQSKPSSQSNLGHLLIPSIISLFASGVLVLIALLISNLCFPQKIQISALIDA